MNEHACSKREPDAAVDPMFPDRWSPRAFKPEPVSEAELAQLFEAARWAPSSMNEQPWRFVYARTPAALARFRPLLREMNQVWASRAPVLIFLFATRRFAADGRRNRTAQFDCGAAWMSLALQARKMGLYTHAMAGIHREATYEALGVPEDEYEVMAALAVGHRDHPRLLPADLRQRECPSSRRQVAEFVFDTAFPAPPSPAP